MSRTRCLTIIGLILVMATMSVPVTSQEKLGESPNHHMITTNPFLILFGWWNIEYEYKLSGNSTLGVAGSYYSFTETIDEEDFLSFDQKTKYFSGYAIYRFHPSGKAHAGFYFGGRLGITSIEQEDLDTGLTDDGSAFGFGLDVGYTWLLGDKQNFAMSVGLGATRLFGADLDDDTVGFLPIIRLVNIGVAF